MVTKKIGEHTVELTSNSTGSFDPWFGDIITKYGIWVMCTSDIGYFLKIDDDIFKIGLIGKANKRVETWEAMYDSTPEEVEREIGYLKGIKPKTRTIDGYPEIDEKFFPVNEMIELWGLTGIYAFESFEKDGKISEETQTNAKTLFSHLFNKGCRVPGAMDITGIGNDIIFKYEDSWIDISEDSLRMSDGHTLKCTKYDIDHYIVPKLRKERRKTQ
jgi:hypothetical protein